MNRAQRFRLESALREEARAQTPAFSPSLHQRVMNALRAQGLPQPTPSRGTQSRSFGWRIGIPLALAAGLALAAWIIMRPTPTQPQPPAPPVAKSPVEAPTFELPNVQAATSTDALSEAKFAYLDRDAKRLWLFVANQIPQLPEPRR